MIRTITAGVFFAIASLGLARQATAMPAHAAATAEVTDRFINVHGSVNRPGYGGHPFWHREGNYRRGPRYDYYTRGPRYYYRPYRRHHHRGYRGNDSYRGQGGYYRGDRRYRGYDQPRPRHNGGDFRKNQYREDTSFIVVGPGKLALR